jgi:formylmethanofuran dehydrogenase subunit C
MSIDAKDSFSLTTKKSTVKSTDVIVDASNITTTGEWAQSGNMAITGNVDTTGNKTVSGNFSTEGNVSLGGGANPLVYDIVLTLGTGNLGAPVVSSNIMLKTVKTKAT